MSELCRITLLWDEMWLAALLQRQGEVHRRLLQIEAETKRTFAIHNRVLSMECKEAVMRQKYMWHSRRKSTFRRQKRKMSFLYQKIALTSFYPMVLVALQYPFVSLSYKRSRPRSYTAEERRNQAKKSRAMFPFTSVKRSRWSDHTHIIPGSRALRWEMS